MSSTHTFFTRQPGKAIWTVVAILIILIRLPFLLIYLIPKSLRPQRTWSYRQAVANESIRMTLHFLSAIRSRTALSLSPGADGARFVTMHPAKADVYRGLLDDAHIRPAVIGGTWFPRPYRAGSKDDENDNDNNNDDNKNNDGHERSQPVILHLHGGAYTIGTARPAESAFGSGMLHETFSSAWVLCPQYRLALSSSSCFPAQLQDAVTAYSHLLSLGIASSRIILSGDSAGGNLVIALLRYLADHDHDHDDPRLPLPHPAAALLWSPWVDLESAQDRARMTQHPKYTVDYLPYNFVSWGAASLVPASMSASHPYISPLHHPFATATPLWIQVGEHEILRDDGVRFATAMAAQDGNRVSWCEVPGAPHDVFLIGGFLGWEKEIKAAVRTAADWLVEMKVLPVGEEEEEEE